MIPSWSDIPVFLSVARSGTLSAAARALHLDRTTISRRIENMERTLNAPLFDRNDGSFSLTPYGRQVFAAAEGAEQELAALGNSQKSSVHKSGKLRVSMSEHLLLTLADCIRDFTVQHSDILLKLTATDRSVDLHHFETDVALRISRGSLSKLESRNIGKPIFSLYRKKGEQPANARYISRPSENVVPKYLGPYLPDAQISVAVDGLVSMKEMIAEGAGAGILPNYFGDRDSRLEQCSDPLPSIGFSLFIAFLPEQRRLHRLKTFVDFMENHLRGMDGFEGR
ncbi:MAG: LysR family transcriptional regulator [Rhizobiaceae bacterium]